VTHPTPGESGENNLLTSAHDRAKRLREALQRQESELASDKLLDPAVREAGLKAVRCAALCAGRLQALAEQTRHKNSPDSQDPAR
jgi:hypothetical protein